MLPTKRSPLAIICLDDFFPDSLHDDVLAVSAEVTSLAAVFWGVGSLASMAASKSWGNCDMPRSIASSKHERTGHDNIFKINTKQFMQLIQLLF
jgi:hypothetical protein